MMARGGEGRGPQVLRGSRRLPAHQVEAGEAADEAAEATIAYIYAAPLVNERMQEVPSLDVSGEWSELRQCLREASKRVRLRKQVATTQNLRMLLTKGCNVLHYTGHGSTEILSFETAAGALEKASMRFLKQLFQAGGVRTKLVFVSACHSENVGRQFVEAGVPHVVAVKTDAKISDEASRMFASSFYFALLSGHTVKSAFEIGVSAVQYDDTEEKFLLLPEEGDHDMQIFSNLPNGQFIDTTPPLPPSDCGNAPDHLDGRSIEIHQVVFYFSRDSRFVTIRGQIGIGKTAIALKAIEYMRERSAFNLFTCVKLFKRPGIDDPNELARSMAERIRIRDLLAEQQQVTDCESFVDYLQEIEKRFGRVLLFLDGCDEYVRENSPLAPILNEIFHRTSSVYILMTSVHGFQSVESFPLESHGQAEKLVSVQTLSPTSVMMLLWRRSPRPLQECFVPPPRDKTDIQTRLLSQRTIQQLRGHPAAILRFARHLADCVLDDSDEMVAKAEEAYVLAQTRPPVLLRDASASTTAGAIAPAAAVAPAPVPQPQVRRQVSRTESTSTDGDASSTRPRVVARHRVHGGQATATVASPIARPPVNTGFQAAFDRAIQHIEDRRCATLWAELTASSHLPKTSVPFSQVAEGLRRMVLSPATMVTGRCRPPAHGTGAYAPRMLSDEDLSFIQSKLLPELSSEQLMPYAMITLENFRQFSTWWGPVLDTLVRIAPEWYSISPTMVHGFVGRATISRWLSDKSPGVFALRFSESYAGFLVISFVDDHSDRTLVTTGADRRPTAHPLAHCLVTVRADGCSISFNNTAERTYPDLRSLVLDCAKLRRLYPNYRKEEVFTLTRPDASRREAVAASAGEPPEQNGAGPPVAAGTAPRVRVSPTVRRGSSVSPSPSSTQSSSGDDAPENTGARQP